MDVAISGRLLEEEGNKAQGSDPLYEYPRDQVGRKRAQSPSLPTIPEEGNGPPRRDGWDQIRENPNIVGMGPPPLSGFFFQPRQPVRGPAPRHLPPGPQPLGPPLPGLPGPRLPVPPPLGPPPPGAPPPLTAVAQIGFAICCIVYFPDRVN
ncbi:hypothetical protein MTO96_036073 [Rhipicephalus appendiculatus]